MRILSVTQSYYPFLDRGGPAVKVRALAAGLAKSGNRVTVLTADLGLDSHRRDAIHATPNRWGFEMREDSVETIYLRTRAHYRAATWNPGLNAFCRERLLDAEVVHIFGLYDLMGPAVARGCRRAQRPYVVEPMGMFRPIVRSIRAKRIYHSVLGSTMLKGAARIIATAEMERQELIEGGIPDHKIAVRRNGIVVPEVLPPLGAFRRRWNIPENAALVLFLGRLVSKKSPDLLIEAFARWRERVPARPAFLVLGGPDETDGFRGRLETLAKQRNVEDAVLITGPLYDDAKWSAYRDADLFVLPSQNENFGNTAAEAVVCGTPVLVTDCCGIAPLLKDRAGLVVPHDIRAIENGLGQILDHESLAAQLRAGCQSAAEALGWAEPLAEMETLYREVIRKSQPG